MKIVTLIPSATEIVAFLGQKKSIIGRSHECDFPEDLSKIIKLTEPKINVEGTSGEIHKQIEVILEKSLSVYKVHVEELKKLKPSQVSAMLSKSSSQSRDILYKRCMDLLNEKFLSF